MGCFIPLCLPLPLSSSSWQKPHWCPQWLHRPEHSNHYMGCEYFSLCICVETCSEACPCMHTRMNPNPFYMPVCLCRKWTSGPTTGRASCTRCHGGRLGERTYTGTMPTHSRHHSWLTTRERTQRLRSKSRLSTHSDKDRRRSPRSDTLEKTVRQPEHFDRSFQWQSQRCDDGRVLYCTNCNCATTMSLHTQTLCVGIINDRQVCKISFTFWDNQTHPECFRFSHQYFKFIEWNVSGVN